MADTQPLQQTRLVIPERVLERSGLRRNVVFLALLAAVALATLYFWTRKPPSGPTFRTVTVAKRTITRNVEATGQLDVLKRVEVPSPVIGQLSAILVTAGTEVHKDQVLAELEAPTAALEEQNARAAQQAAWGRVAEAQAALNAARDTRARTERLATKGLVSEQELAAARSAEDKAKAALGALRGEGAVAAGGVRSAQLAKNQRIIRAPVDGVVLVAPNWRGAVVAPDKGPVFVIGSSLSTMRIDVSVAESDIGEVRVGQRAHFSVPAFGGRVFEALVDRVQIEPRRDRGVVTYPVTLKAANADHTLLPGMTATVRIEVAEAKDVLAVREAALRFTPPDEEPGDTRSQLWRSPDGRRAEAIEVVPGLSDGAYTEVKPKDGAVLQAGDAIAIGMAKAQAGDDNGPGITLGKKQ